MVRASISAPSPPAKAISAAATASPPSLRSWQARTSPAWIAWCRAANVCLATAASTFGTSPPDKPFDQREMRAAQFVLRHADEIQQIARLLQVHRHAAADVVDLAQGADQQRRRDGDRLVGALRAGIRCSGCPCR